MKVEVTKQTDFIPVVISIKLESKEEVKAFHTFVYGVSSNNCGLSKTEIITIEDILNCLTTSVWKVMDGRGIR